MFLRFCVGLNGVVAVCMEWWGGCVVYIYAPPRDPRPFFRPPGVWGWSIGLLVGWTCRRDHLPSAPPAHSSERPRTCLYAQTSHRRPAQRGDCCLTSRLSTRSVFLPRTIAESVRLPRPYVTISTFYCIILAFERNKNKIWLRCVILRHLSPLDPHRQTQL